LVKGCGGAVNFGSPICMGLSYAGSFSRLSTVLMQASAAS